MPKKTPAKFERKQPETEAIERLRVDLTVAPMPERKTSVDARFTLTTPSGQVSLNGDLRDYLTDTEEKALDAMMNRVCIQAATDLGLVIP